MNIETVNLGERSYPIFIGKGASSKDGAIKDKLESNDVLILSNESIAPLYLDSLKENLPNKNIVTYLLPDGEKEKTLKNVHKIIHKMLEEGFGRDATLISLGGGVICDIGGFTASIFMRGINLIQVPTTLLAQVDASVGGKTGVNNNYGKNLVGSFYQPSAVVCDTGFLSTLNDKEISDGLAEVIKYGLIYDDIFLEWLKENLQKILKQDQSALDYAIQRSCQIKAEIVSTDEKEHSIRAILNFGHTFGHAIELQTGYNEWSHGQAVAVGMMLASKLSAKMSLLTNAEIERVQEILAEAGLPTEPPAIAADDFIKSMQSDKKVKGRQIQLVLLKKIGEAFLTSEYSEEHLLEVLEAR